MAIDTENKRRSALGKVLPRPDGTISQGDRQHKVWKYAGILATAAIDVLVISERYDLIGSSIEKFALVGSSIEKFALVGSDSSNQTLTGA